MYKLLALDLDGTLLRADGAADPRDLDAIAALRRGGVLMTIITGRLFEGASLWARELGVSGPVACLDGAILVDATSGREIRRVLIGLDAARDLKTVLAAQDAAVFVLAGKEVLYDRRGAPLAERVAAWAPTLIEVDSVLDHACWPGGLTAVMTIADAQTAAAVEGSVAGVQARRFALEPGTDVVWLQAGGVSKATALEAVAAHHRVPLRDVVAIGDAHADIPMLMAAGRSFAMGDAPPEVRRAASDALRATSAEGGGVAEAAAAVWPEILTRSLPATTSGFGPGPMSRRAPESCVR